MKKFIMYILVFFVVVIIIDQFVGFVGDYMLHNSKPSPAKQFDDLCLNDNHDILIMGSSRALHHYIPQIIGDTLCMDVYNAGYGGNGIILAYGILQMIIEREPPKYILYDIAWAFDLLVYEPDDNNTRYLSTLKKYRKHDGVAEVLKDISWGTYLKSFSGIYRYNSDLLNSIKYFWWGSTFYEDGYVPLYGELNDSTRQNTEIELFAEDNTKIKYLHKFVQTCQENDICLIFALSPQYGYIDERVIKLIKKISEQYNITLLDYYDVFQNDMTLFQDELHMNDKGATEYSKKVAVSLREFINSQ